MCDLMSALHDLLNECMPQRVAPRWSVRDEKIGRQRTIRKMVQVRAHPPNIAEYNVLDRVVVLEEAL